MLRARRAYGEVLVVFGAFFAAGIAAAAFLLAGPGISRGVSGWPEAVTDSIAVISTTVLCVLVPVLLAARRGLGRDDLGLRVRGPGLTPGRHVRIAAWALLALIAGGEVTNVLATHSFPFGPRTAPNLLANLAAGVQAGFIEEIVVLAFVVVTLEQARRPRAEIVAVAVLLRASYHIYYGPGVLGVLVWAPAFVWLFLRFRTIVPLIAVHSAWDVLGALARWWRPVAGIEVVAWLALFVLAFVSWLHDREAGRTAPVHDPDFAWPAPGAPSRPHSLPPQPNYVDLDPWPPPRPAPSPAGGSDDSPPDAPSPPSDDHTGV